MRGDRVPNAIEFICDTSFYEFVISGKNEGLSKFWINATSRKRSMVETPTLFAISSKKCVLNVVTRKFLPQW